MIVTIDGPAGTGKSTVARRLAARLGFQFLDTGATYRAVGLKCLQLEIDVGERAAVGELAGDLTIRFDGKRVLIDDEDVTEAIRAAEVSEAASVVASHPAVREAMVKLQRSLAAEFNTVTEGRDQGTVAFPRAECKFFLTADRTVRAGRRHAEMLAQGSDATLAEVLAKMIERDDRDENREIAPLKPADGAELVDTSALSIDDAVDLLERKVRDRMSG